MLGVTDVTVAVSIVGSTVVAGTSVRLPLAVPEAMPFEVNVSFDEAFDVRVFGFAA